MTVRYRRIGGIDHRHADEAYRHDRPQHTCHVDPYHYPADMAEGLDREDLEVAKDDGASYSGDCHIPHNLDGNEELVVPVVNREQVMFGSDELTYEENLALSGVKCELSCPHPCAYAYAIQLAIPILYARASTLSDRGGAHRIGGSLHPQMAAVKPTSSSYGRYQLA